MEVGGLINRDEIFKLSINADIDEVRLLELYKIYASNNNTPVDLTRWKSRRVAFLQSAKTNKMSLFLNNKSTMSFLYLKTFLRIIFELNYPNEPQIIINKIVNAFVLYVKENNVDKLTINQILTDPTALKQIESLYEL